MLGKRSAKFWWGWTLILAATFTIGFRTADKYFEISRNMDIFGKVYTEVNEVYVDETNPTDMMQTGITAMLEGLDPYTNFFPESQIEQSMVLNSGSLSGIGAEIGLRGNQILILELFQGGPADQAGLRVGDAIQRIDQEAVGPGARNLEEARSLLLGERGTTVDLQIRRPGSDAPLSLAVQRGSNEVQRENVPFYDLAREDIGYILLSNFMGNAGSEVAAALQDLKERNPDLKGVILDLRGNPGGRLDEAVNVCNVFIPRGEFVTEMKGRTRASNQRFMTLQQPIDTEIPLVVMVDGNSASASEIVSGTIQDLDRGVILGRTSFGKGLVQNVKPLSYNTQMKVTIARYFIPSGRCIQKLDYFHRNADGTPGQVPDSAIQEFRTRNGRRVYDGGGIAPEVNVPKPALQPVSQALKDQGLIFDFVTAYSARVDSISAPREFAVSNALYQEFVSFVQGRDFEFSTESEANLLALQETLAEGQFRAELTDEVARIQAELAQQKSQDLQTHQAEIKELLRQAIVSRYHYKQGLLTSGFSFDPDILKAVEVLDDLSGYNQILQP